MYQPKKYKKDDLEFAIQLIDENPFANFILTGDDLLATHIPILRNLDSKNYNYTAISRITTLN